MGKEAIKKTKPSRSLINLDEQTSSLFTEYNLTKKDETRNKIVESYESLVKRATSKIFKNELGHAGYEDMVQEGFIGLIQATEKFDIDKETRFSTYAYKRIIGSIKDSFRRLDWVPRLVRQRTKIINSAHDIAKAKYREPTQEQVKNELAPRYVASYDLIVKDTVPLKMISLEGLIKSAGFEDSLNNNQILEHKTQKQSVEIIEENNFWNSISRGFSEREREILFQYYRKEIPLKKIGENLGFSESRASQIKKSIEERLKTNEVILGWLY